MTSTTFFQAFLIVDVFVLGGLTALTVRHARAHFKPPTNDEGEKPHLSASVREHLLKESKSKFESVLNNEVEHLQSDLKSTSGQINGMIKDFAADIVGEELKNYREELAQLHKQAEANLGGIKESVGNHQAEIEAKFTEEMELERQKLIKQIDVKLADAVASFLLEALQHNVDLGTQSEYLVALLEEHKDEFKKEITHEV